MFRLLNNRVFETVMLIAFVAAVAAGAYRDSFNDGPWLPPEPSFAAAVAAGGYRDGFKDGPWMPPSPWDNLK